MGACLMLILLIACAPAATLVAPPVRVDLATADAPIASALEARFADASQAPTDAERRGILGMAYEANGFAEAALDTYAQAEQLNRGDPRWPYYLALLTAHRGHLDQALAHLQRAIDLDPDYAPAWLWQGTWMLEQNQLDSAVGAFKRAKALGETLPAIVGESRVLLRQKQANAVVELLTPLAERSTHPFLYGLIGQAYAQLGQREQAEEVLALANNASPPGWTDARTDAKRGYAVSISVRLERARKLLQEGRVTLALESIKPLQQQYPDHQGLLTTLSEAYRQAGQADAALAVLQQGASVYPDYYIFQLNIADHYIQSAEGDKAFTYLQRAIQLNPEVAWAHAQLGLLLVDQGKLDDALQSFADAERLEPNDPHAFYYAGMVYASRAAWPDALSRFEQSVAIDPSFTLGFIALGRTRTMTRDFDGARTALESAQRLDTHPGETQSALTALDQAMTTRK